ncbi:hypothetical protein M422DRAFT_32279 [Sphaerobolus stellatus SS14]|uniref:Nephrocystin 3-like N-terminal domain-containing protein n=1 Tax=Sphaerobolus stellatus (strain SS14) TaxID=990650 RepID=A0A0C9VQI0_SPHS4|nr:hypothetical protein M422DRAFT_32279 [Sphaerobolus stellatus SS14]
MQNVGNAANIAGLASGCLDLLGVIKTSIGYAVEGELLLDGRADRDSRREEVAILMQLLTLLMSRLKEISTDPGVLSAFEIPELEKAFVRCIIILTDIKNKLKGAEQNVGTAAQIFWPFTKDYLAEKLDYLKKMAHWLHIALQYGIGKMVENIQKYLHIFEKNFSTVGTQLTGIASGQQDIGENLKTTQRAIGTVHEAVSHIKFSITEQERHDLATWLSPVNVDETLIDNLDGHSEGTADWIFKTSQMKAWMTGELRFLWCQGPPGVGKTMIA